MMTSLEDSTHQEPGGHLTLLEPPLQVVMVAEMPELEPAATDRSRHSACSTRTSQSRCTRRPRKYLALVCGIYWLLFIELSLASSAHQSVFWSSMTSRVKLLLLLTGASL